MKKLAVSLACGLVLVFLAMSSSVFALISEKTYIDGQIIFKDQIIQKYQGLGIRNNDDVLNYIERTNPPLEKAKFVFFTYPTLTEWQNPETKQRVFVCPFLFYLFEKRERGELNDVYVFIYMLKPSETVKQYNKRIEKARKNILDNAMTLNLRAYEVEFLAIAQSLYEDEFMRGFLQITEQEAKENDFRAKITRVSQGDQVELEGKVYARHTASTFVDSYKGFFDKIFEWIENEEQIYKKIKEAKNQ